MLAQMLSLGGWIMFVLGVIFSGSVMGLWSRVRSGVGA